MNKEHLSEELKEIISRFEIGSVIKIEELTSSGNICFLFKTEQKRYLVRLCPEGQRWRSVGEIAAEIELLDFLKSKNFPVHTALRDQNNEFVISWKNHNGYIREYDEGKGALNPTTGQVEKFGEILGWFHSLIENFKTKNERPHIFNLDTTNHYFNENKKMILKSNYTEKEIFVREFEKKINQLNFPDALPMGSIHEDLGKRHVLWNNNEISAIIDFDRFYYGFLLLDLGQACRGWCFENDFTKWNNEKFNALISGYKKNRKLADLEEKHLIDSIKFGILERAQSFYLRYVAGGNVNNAQFALNSVTHQFMLISHLR